MVGKRIDFNNINRNPFEKIADTPEGRAEKAEKRIEAKYSEMSGGLGALIERRGGIVGELGAERIYQNGMIVDNGTEAIAVYGGIYQKYHALGLETSFLGDPLTDETGTPDGVGRFNHFQGGSIYWTPQTGAQEVHGDIRDKWAALGWERSFLGYPVTDEMDNPDRNKSGRYSRFQGGFISWTPDTEAQVHRDGTNAVFSVDNIFITTTRNGNIAGTAKDTVVVALQMNVGSQLIGPVYKNLGELKGGGPYPVNLSISAPANDPAALVSMSFLMSHSSDGDTADLRESSHKGLNALAAAGIGAAVGAIGGPWGAAIGALAGVIYGAVGNLLFANCDGPVAADTVHVSGATLNDEIAPAPHSEHKDYPGYVSQDGCGANPLYSVTWSITQQV